MKNNDSKFNQKPVPLIDQKPVPLIEETNEKERKEEPNHVQ